MKSLRRLVVVSAAVAAQFAMTGLAVTAARAADTSAPALLVAALV